MQPGQDHHLRNMFSPEMRTAVNVHEIDHLHDIVAVTTSVMCALTIAEEVVVITVIEKGTATITDMMNEMNHGEMHGLKMMTAIAGGVMVVVIGEIDIVTMTEELIVVHTTGEMTGGAQVQRSLTSLPLF